MRDRPLKLNSSLLWRASLVFLCWFEGGCQKAPPDLREWTPKDHNNQSNQVAASNRQVPASPTPEEAPPAGLDAVTLAAWGANCALCHGKVGRGDGPQGPMLKAPDLSNPEWQLQVSDSQIRQTIESGKKSMPSFAHLPSATLDGLTLLVRWFNRDQAALKQRFNSSSVASTTPAASTSAPASGPAVSGKADSSSGAASGEKTQVKSNISAAPVGSAATHP